MLRGSVCGHFSSLFQLGLRSSILQRSRNNPFASGSSHQTSQLCPPGYHELGRARAEQIYRDGSMRFKVPLGEIMHTHNVT